MKKITIILLKGGGIVLPFFLFMCKSTSEVNISPLGTINHPQENAQSNEKIELGRALFFDKRLSLDSSISCSSCHIPQFAFTDRRKVSQGIKGRITKRNSPTILNSGYLETVMFDAHLESLEMQVIVPIQEHVEMDIPMAELIARLSKDERYMELANKIYNRDFDAWVLTRSISAFERSLISDQSRFDTFYYRHNKSALNKSEKAGWKLFSEKLYCTKCHPAPHFTSFKAENNGLYKDYGEDEGRFRIHHDSSDIGKFKVPTLRNIALTYPYMHDGSFKTLHDVIEHYSRGGAGHLNQNKAIQPFTLTASEKRDLIAFLESLTDTSYMSQFRFK